LKFGLRKPITFAQEADEHWDLKRLYADLASAKGKQLTPVEKQHLCGFLLCGYSPAEMAEWLHKSLEGLEVSLCRGLYQYVKTLKNRGSEKVENWRQISDWLEEAGYKTPSTKPFQLSKDLPVDAALDVAANVVNMSRKVNIEKNKIDITRCSILNWRIIMF
jgi:hypothetical protein